MPRKGYEEITPHFDSTRDGIINDPLGKQIGVVSGDEVKDTSRQTDIKADIKPDPELKPFQQMFAGKNK